MAHILENPCVPDYCNALLQKECLSLLVLRNSFQVKNSLMKVGRRCDEKNFPLSPVFSSPLTSAHTYLLTYLCENEIINNKRLLAGRGWATSNYKVLRSTLLFGMLLKALATYIPSTYIRCHPFFFVVIFSSCCTINLC